MAWDVSDAYLSQIAQSHQATGLARVCLPSGDVLAEIPVRSGQIEADADRPVLRSARIDLLDSTGEFIPRGYGDLLHPWTGNELRLFRSVTLPDGAVETIPMGVFRIGAPTVEQSAEGATISLDGFDRSSRVAANAWTYVVSAFGKTMPEAIRDALLDRFPALPVSVAESDQVAPSVWFYPGMEDNPWVNIIDLAKAGAWAVEVDRLGVAVAKPDITPSGVARIWTEGPTCTVTDVRRELPAADGPNGVLAMGGDVRRSFRVEKWVEDPAHPLWRGGRYGEVAEVLSEQFADETAAEAAVDKRLAEILTGVTGVSVSMIPDAALDVRDRVQLEAPRVGISGLFTVRRIACPAGSAGTMQVELEAV